MGCVGNEIDMSNTALFVKRKLSIGLQPHESKKQDYKSYFS